MRIAFDKLNFLVADPNEHAVTLLKTSLRAFGSHSVHVANDGFTALEIAETHSTDFVMTEIQLPGLNGIELIRLLRASGTAGNPFRPIIAVSACTTQRHVLAARNAGVSDFLVKPYSPAVLHARIRQAVEKPPQFIRTPTYLGPDRRSLEREPATEAMAAPAAAPETRRSRHMEEA